MDKFDGQENIQVVKIFRWCLLPLSRCLKRIAAVTRPKTAPYLADVTQKSIPKKEIYKEIKCSQVS